MRTLSATLLLLCALPLSGAPPVKTIVLVIDGLRPDSIVPEIMPNLASLKAAGTFYSHAHSIFPSVTRVNSASLGTGSFPDRTGIVSNSIYLEAVNPAAAFDTADYRSLLKLGQVNGGRAVPVPNWGELVTRAGRRFVAMTSGSTGSGFLLNPEAANGVGVAIAGFEPHRVAYPDSVNEVVLKRFGAIQADSGLKSLGWAERILREYVLPELKPDLLADWVTEPDGNQHRHGVGSPEALDALKQVDAHIGKLLGRLRELGLDRQTNIVVVSDHGFSANTRTANIGAAMSRAGVSRDDIVVANNGQSALLYVRGRDAAKIQKLALEFEEQPGVGAVFTAARKPTGSPAPCDPKQQLGWIQGTFSLDFIHQCHASTGADILIAMDWDSNPNAFGVKGTHAIAAFTEPANLPMPGASGHGGLNPWSVGTTLILSGPSFKEKAEISTAAGNQDILPTVLAAMEIPVGHTIDGRVLKEAFRSSKGNAPATRTQEIAMPHGPQVKLRYSEVEGHIYLDAVVKAR